MFLAPQLPRFIFNVLFATERSAGNIRLGVKSVINMMNGEFLSFTLSTLQAVLSVHKFPKARIQTAKHEGIKSTQHWMKVANNRTECYLELMEHWGFLQDTRRDAAVMKGIQERVIALISAAQLTRAEEPDPVAPIQADDNALSALDEEIAAMQQMTSAVLTTGSAHNSTVTDREEGLNGREGGLNGPEAFPPPAHANGVPEV